MNESENIMLIGMLRYDPNITLDNLSCYMSTYKIDICIYIVILHAKIFDVDLQVTAEDMEAYRMKKIHRDDPMKDFLH